MIHPPCCSLYLHYVVKEGKVDELVSHIRTILDACAGEEDFITAVLHRTPERPLELTLYELWRGTKETFAKTQGTRPYRKAYMEASKPLVDTVKVTWDTPLQIWGEFGPLG
ncbi:putative quinol monooxygenase [Luteibacter jiangsuensis]